MSMDAPSSALCLNIDIRKGPRGELRNHKLQTQHEFKGLRRAAAIHRKDGLIMHLQEERIRLSWQAWCLSEAHAHLVQENSDVSYSLESALIVCAEREQDLVLSEALNQALRKDVVDAQEKCVVSEKLTVSLKQALEDKSRQEEALCKEMTSLQQQLYDTINKAPVIAPCRSLAIQEGISFVQMHTLPEKSVEDAFLQERQGEIKSMLDKLQEAASFFDTSEFESIKEAGETYWRLFVPEGVMQMEVENEQIGNQLNDIETNWLGHLFAFDRGQFELAVRSFLGNSCQDLVCFMTQCAPAAQLRNISKCDYIEMYLAMTEDAF